MESHYMNTSIGPVGGGSVYGGAGASAGSVSPVESPERAVYHISQALYNDCLFDDLSDLLQVPRFNEPSTSGILESDYPTLSDVQPIGQSSLGGMQQSMAGFGSSVLGGVGGGAGGHEIAPIKKTPLPTELIERFGHLQSNCLMGLFTEINRAWLSIDNDIFVWNYKDGSDVAYFDGLSEMILCVQLARPKPGIFQPHIMFLLCLTTPIDIVLLGVSFVQSSTGVTACPGNYEEMSLLPEPLFSLSTDGLYVTCIQSTLDGRIFLGGRDGCLYELIYQADGGWFSRKCYKVNHSRSRLSFVIPAFLTSTLSEDDALAQISIDESRHILYTRSEKGTLQVFDLGWDGRGMSRIASASMETTFKNACLIVKNRERKLFQPIVEIAAIPQSESHNIHLVAVTQMGVRLYFSTTDFVSFSSPTYSYDRSGSSTTSNLHGTLQQIDSVPAPTRPFMLNLVHVRMPPGFSVHGSPLRPTDVTSALYRSGTLILASSHPEENDRLWIISSDNFPFQQKLTELHEIATIDGRVWSIAEIPPVVPPTPRYPLFVVGHGINDPPVVVSQHNQILRQYVVINSQGTYLLTKLSPVDQLEQMLVEFGPDSTEVKCYFQKHQVQACATALVLICSRNVSHMQVNSLATKAFFQYGGEPEYQFIGSTAAASAGGPIGHSTPAPGVSFAPGTISSSFASPSASTPRGQLNFQSPVPLGSIFSPATTPGGAQPSELIFSYKHRAICLYIARILRPVWETHMVQEMTLTQKSKGKQTYLTSVVDSHQMAWILCKLEGVRDFMDEYMTPRLDRADSTLMGRGVSSLVGMQPSMQYPSRQSIGGDQMIDEQTRRRYRESAELEENSSLRLIHSLTAAACEYLGLWKILTEHQFHIIASNLTNDQRATLRGMTFHTLLTCGRDVCQTLIKHLVSMYVDDNAATDVISARLRDLCPSLYGCTDEIFSKGSEKFKSARNSQSQMERERLMEEALTCFKGISTTVDLPFVSSQFAAVRFYRGIVDLSLTASAKRDPQCLALHYYNNHKPGTDLQGASAYATRMDAYRPIFESLDYLLNASLQSPITPAVPSLPGAPPPNDPTRLSGADAERYAEEMFCLGLKSDDQMFHIALYDWLICKNMQEKLLEIQSPYLESYLKQGASSRSDNLAFYDLLWKLYEKQRNFAAAARILSRLAERQGNELSLHQRIGYLSRACVCAKSCTVGVTAPGDGDFLHELEEKMDVARLQLQIFDVLSKSRGVDVDVLDRLNSGLFDITVLFSDFAEPHDLAEIKLAILHSAGHQDAAMVEAFWTDIINKEVQQRADSEATIIAIQTVLKDQAKLYHGSDSYFPVVFLVKHLELVSCELELFKRDISFVYRALSEAGVQINRLFDVYDRLFKSKDACWRNLRHPYHLLFVIAQLLMDFTGHGLTHSERNQFIVRAQDSIARYLVDLQAETNLDPRHQGLVRTLRGLQAQLDRV